MITLYPEYAIAVKKLTDAELDRDSSSSSQTHIGLSEKVLTFLPNSPVQTDGILIFNKSCSMVECAFSKIGNKRSTKIDTQTTNPIKSVVKQIRNIASNPKVDWYLVWFALSNQIPVFWLINSNSEDWNELNTRVQMPQQLTVYNSAKEEYYKILGLVRHITKFDDLVSNKFDAPKNQLIAKSREHRTFVHLCMDYFRGVKSLDKMISYFNTMEQDTPVQVESSTSGFKLPNMFIFSDLDAINDRNTIGQSRRWYTDPFPVDNRELYLYVDWYPGLNKKDDSARLIIPDFVTFVQTCFGNQYVYKHSNEDHEMWLVNDPDSFVNSSPLPKHWIIPSNNDKFKLIDLFDATDVVDWYLQNKINVGDIGYFYCSGDYKRILYKAVVEKVNVKSSEYINDLKYWVNIEEKEQESEKKEIVRFKLLGKLNKDDERLKLEVLRNHGLKGNIQGPMGVPTTALQVKLDEVFDETSNPTVLPKDMFEEQPKITQIPFEINKVVKAISSTKLLYEELLVKRFVCSLLTKPFVILSGLAGSGKTQLAIAFAKAMVEDENTQMCVVPVGADWTNREPLLGYPNALKNNEYVFPESGALDLLIESNKPENQQKPYFLILDEMNLSYVERYFADFLSAMESHQKIQLRKKCEEGDDDTPNSVSLPKNLFIIGTINVDETTYQFSPKVLDRANVIEFKVSEKEMENFLNEAPVVEMKNVENACADMAADFVKIAQDKVDASTVANEVLKKFFKQLKSVNAEFGYRSAAEIGRFISLATSKSDIEENDSVDAAIVQKLLPKLHGSRKKIVPVLEELWKLCVSGNDIKEMDPMKKEVPQKANYPISADKIMRMYWSAIDNGFTSFAEA